MIKPACIPTAQRFQRAFVHPYLPDKKKKVIQLHTLGGSELNSDSFFTLFHLKRVIHSDLSVNRLK